MLAAERTAALVPRSERHVAGRASFVRSLKVQSQQFEVRVAADDPKGKKRACFEPGLWLGPCYSERLSEEALNRKNPWFEIPREPP